MKRYGNGSGNIQRRTGERRKFRGLLELYLRDRICDFPTDKESLWLLKENIMNFIDYCYLRTDEKGSVEDEMVEELHNIALILRGYYEVDKGEQWKSDFNDFHKSLFSYALKQGLKHNKGLVAELLTRSEFLHALDIYIFQYQEYEFNPDLVLDYNDISIESRNMLCFMTHRVCPTIKKEIKIDLNDLSVDDLLTGIKTGYFTDKKEEAGNRLRYFLNVLKEEDDKERYDNIVRKILMLYIDYLIDISSLVDLIKDHVVYKLLYCPETVDYETIELKTFINIKSRIILNNAIDHGGYCLFKRLLEEYNKNRDIIYIEAFSEILNNEKLRRMYKEEQAEERMRRKGKP